MNLKNMQEGIQRDVTESKNAVMELKSRMLAFIKGGK